VCYEAAKFDGEFFVLPIRLGRPMTTDKSAELCRCGHDTDQHDELAERYCAATLWGGLKRGCICAAAGGTKLDRSTGRAVRAGR
jgi:hypothetical protein